jgi:hypothetical protein
VSWRPPAEESWLAAPQRKSEHAQPTQVKSSHVKSSQVKSSQLQLTLLDLALLGSIEHAVRRGGAMAHRHGEGGARLVESQSVRAARAQIDGDRIPREEPTPRAPRRVQTAAEHGTVDRAAWSRSAHATTQGKSSQIKCVSYPPRKKSTGPLPFHFQGPRVAAACARLDLRYAASVSMPPPLEVRESTPPLPQIERAT